MSRLGTACAAVVVAATLKGDVFSQTPLSLDQLAIAVRTPSREFCFTNKQSTFYYGETNGPLRSSWQGLNVGGIECLDDFRIAIEGQSLDPSRASVVNVFPDRLERHYPDGTSETLRLTDSLSILSVTLTLPHPGSISVAPLFADGRSADDFSLVLHDSLALIGRRRGERGQVSGPWLAVSLTRGAPSRTDTRDGSRYSPVALASRRALTHVIAFAVDTSGDRARELARTYPRRASAYALQRRRRMEQILSRAAVVTSDARFDRAMAWAVLSLDALVMNQGGKGIFAGLPWFNNYWGRDTFIALPGAALVTGQYEEARAILRSFARFQQTDPASTDDGRIPNFVGPSGIAYNTADGTPRFAAMARAYVERSGDTAFAREVFPVIRRSIEGTLLHHSDTLGFLTHADAESWMDAVGGEGPWSPRGNRANDVQALWIAQLEAGIDLARGVRDTASEHRWQTLVERARDSFLKFFIRDGRIADHLNPDGSADGQVRPNQVFTGSLLPPALRGKMVRTVLTELTYPYGVASLGQEDENFHPYHVHPPFYPKDAAYHNGTVWTWLQGTLISELCRLGRGDIAWALTQSAVHQILVRGAVGTQSELIDALPRPGSEEPELSGTFSQAWNLAEFVRNFYDDYLGVSVSGLPRRLTIRPCFPPELKEARAVINLGSSQIRARIDLGSAVSTVLLDGSALDDSLAVDVSLQDGDAGRVRCLLRLAAGDDARLELRRGRLFLTVKGVTANPLIVSRADSPPEAADLVGATFLSPRLRQGLRALAPPPHTVLSHAEIKRRPTGALVLADAEDPPGDDLGVPSRPGMRIEYTYPAGQPFLPGILDIRRMRVLADTSHVYFDITLRALSDPGWHTEYGFQLTMLAIAVDSGGTPGSGRTDIGHNAHYSLPRANGCERLVLIGGGVEVEDEAGRTLAAYVPSPVDVADPLGNAPEGRIRFAIPQEILGRPRAGWTFTLLSGGQDDHGGAGLGEFRNVGRERTDWSGGGKMDPSGTNLYDMLVATAR